MTARYLYVEDITALTGISQPVVRKMLSQSRRAHEAGTARPVHLPLPAGYVRRPVFNGHHMVTTLSPRWRPSDVRAWLAARPGTGSPGRPRHRSPAA